MTINPIAQKESMKLTSFNGMLSSHSTNMHAQMTPKLMARMLTASMTVPPCSLGFPTGPC